MPKSDQNQSVGISVRKAQALAFKRKEFGHVQPKRLQVTYRNHLICSIDGNGLMMELSFGGFRFFFLTPL